MTAPKPTGHALASPVILPWMPGPSAAMTGPVVVSVTEYQSTQRRDLPGVVGKGMRMRLGWYAMPGAVGLWLWSLPARLCGGSISVWDNEESLERFITLPHHTAIMDRYRDRGNVRSNQWTMQRFDAEATLSRARDWITTDTTTAASIADCQ
jgi:hypothetical protein